MRAASPQSEVLVTRAQQARRRGPVPPPTQRSLPPSPRAARAATAGACTVVQAVRMRKTPPLAHPSQQAQAVAGSALCAQQRSDLAQQTRLEKVVFDSTTIDNRPSRPEKITRARRSVMREQYNRTRRGRGGAARRARETVRLESPLSTRRCAIAARVPCAPAVRERHKLNANDGAC